MGAALAATRASPPQGGAFRTARAGANFLPYPLVNKLSFTVPLAVASWGSSLKQTASVIKT